jgi:hypothetical protein
MTKITVVLHTVNGDVRTAYGPNCEQHALSLINQYTLDGKNFSVEQSKW